MQDGSARALEQPFAQRRDHIARAPGDVAPRVFAHEVAEVLQLVAPLGVPGPFGWRAVPAAARDLDDQTVGLEAEVDAGDGSSIATVMCSSEQYHAGMR